MASLQILVSMMLLAAFSDIIDAVKESECVCYGIGYAKKGLKVFSLKSPCFLLTILIPHTFISVPQNIHVLNYSKSI